jgi:2'-5' RNA ligase
MKQFVKLFEEFSINENRNEHPYGCSMVFVKYPELFKIQDAINPDDLHDNGFEDEPHVTLLYGIHDGNEHDELTKDKLQEIIDISKPCLGGPIILKGITAFENDDYDVLKFDAEADSLREANKKLSEFPNSNSFPDYMPHVTIAYLKPGKAKEYIEKFKDIKDVEVDPAKIVYSRPNGTRVEEYPIDESLDEIDERLTLAEEYLEFLHENIDEGLTLMDIIAKIKNVYTFAKNMKDKAAEALKKGAEKTKEAADKAANMKKKEGKTPDKEQAEVYAARGKEEAAKAKVAQAKMKYDEAKIALADAKTAVANAKMKKASKAGK